ncbi:MAG: TetR/AcrR family transcriptional regulator [bacterium]|nr:TetR/AcrR family transcriptional regulator [bacterium]
MGRPRDPASRERILAVAARLFAERGFEGTTTRAIAAEVGANIATVHYHVGCKADLFRLVLEDFYREEMEVLKEQLQVLEEPEIIEVGQVVHVLKGMANAMIDLMVLRPERPRLYLRRWLDPADEIRSLEIRTSLEIHAPLRALLEDAQKKGIVDPALPATTFLRSFMWMIFGYFATGPIDWERWFSDPLEPSHLEDLRLLVEHFIQHSLEQPWPTPFTRDRAGSE